MAPHSASAMPTASPSNLRLGPPHATHTPNTTHSDILERASRSKHNNITGDITRAAMEDFRQLFDMFDRNGDEEIDSTEFAEIVRMLGDECPSNAELSEMIRGACEINEGMPTPRSLTFPQLMRFFAIYKQDWPTQVSDADIFNVLDEDGGGTISPKELCKVLNRFGMRVSEDEANAMADFGTPFPGPNEITSADMADVAVQVRRLRERDNERSSTDSSED